MNCMTIFKIATVILPICCYGGTVYMVAILFCKYQPNLDSSQTSMKRFNESPVGKYPSFTFCINAEEGKLFNNEILQREYNLTNTDYYELLTGKMNDKNGILTKINFDEIIYGIEELLEEFEAEDHSYQKYNEWTPSMKNISKLPLDYSYQDPTTNCVTYNTAYSNTVSLQTLKIKFNSTQFQRLFDHAGKLYVLAHYPGLMIREMKIYFMKIKDWHLLKPLNGNNDIRIQLLGVTSMRFRENAIEPCDPKLVDDDSV